MHSTRHINNKWQPRNTMEIIEIGATKKTDQSHYFISKNVISREKKKVNTHITFYAMSIHNAKHRNKYQRQQFKHCSDSLSSAQFACKSNFTLEMILCNSLVNPHTKNVFSRVFDGFIRLIELLT